MGFHTNYWTCSAFADWIRGTAKPESLELSEWSRWHSDAKKYPIRYWIAEEGLEHLQDFVYFVPNKINDIRYHLNNRFYTKTHALTSNLPRGQFHEFDTRMLHCLFDELVNFVEVEKAWMLVCWNDDAKSKYAVPLFRRKWWLRWFQEWRCAEAGLNYLDWEISLVNNDWCDETHPEYGKPTQQALTAAETKELYTWWTSVRPNRPDPYDASGWSAIYEARTNLIEGKRNWDNLFHSEKTPEEREATSIALDKCNQIEQQYDNEDTEMLIRLVKIRKSLWT